MIERKRGKIKQTLIEIERKKKTENTAKDKTKRKRLSGTKIHTK